MNLSITARTIRINIINTIGSPSIDPSRRTSRQRTTHTSSLSTTTSRQSPNRSLISTSADGWTTRDTGWEKEEGKMIWRRTFCWIR